MSIATANRSRPHADTDRAAHWSDRAACAGERLPEFESSTDAAKAICATCPVRPACLADAMAEEGTDGRGYRAGVRGGLDAGERADLARPGGQKDAAGDLNTADELVRAAALCDREIAERTGVKHRTVSKLRRSLGLPAVRDPQAKPEPTLQERFNRRTVPAEGGHLLWTGGPGLQIGSHANRRTVSGMLVAFELGHGRPHQGAVRVLCGMPGCVAWQHLADRPLRDALAAAATPPAPPAVPAPVEYLYGVEPPHWEGNDDVWVPARVVRFRITRKTSRRIWYVRSERPDAPRIGSVNRVQLEAEGQVYRASGTGWWEPDKCLYLAPPVVAPDSSVRPPARSVAELRQAMAAAHPDRGGTDEEFMAARAAYQEARRAARTGAQR
ncbi:WhiB family transcriptional regulator [Streptomyces sp. NPDC012765]|uniref:WhiB family transcriptional regulator n=1 Tax=Streptomyces sp. NPDC012765 TaxID=3155249 RepID=UPI003401D7B6